MSAYALTFASIMLACGMIGDEFGRKKVMLCGAGVFCGGSVMCALAPNVAVLIAGRAVMGLGAAASEPGTLSMLRQLYTDERSRNRAVGIWAAVTGLALAAGPVVGGILVGIWNWRAIFWFNLVFGLLALLVAAKVLPESADPDANRVDTSGTLLGATALAALVFGIIGAESAGFAAPQEIVLFSIAAVAAVAFFYRGAPGRAPPARPEISAHRAVRHREYCRVLLLLRYLRDLLLHRALPRGGGWRVRVRHRPGVPADDGADDPRLGPGRPLGGPDRPARTGPRWLPDLRALACC